jgi:hypothetical protein
VRPHSASLFDFDFYEPLPMRVTMFDTTLNFRADQLLPRQFDERIDLTTIGIILGDSVRNAKARFRP